MTKKRDSVPASAATSTEEDNVSIAGDYLHIEDPSFSLGETSGSSPHKKHKKHKHKKHKRKKGTDQDADDGSGGGSPGSPGGEGGRPSLKLKIKFGGQTLGETSVVKSEITEAVSEDSQNVSVVDVGEASAEGATGTSKPQAKGKQVDEEEAWLEALEEGRLEEVDDELRHMKDPNLMTARQRALLESKVQKEKEEPPAPVVQKEMSEEMLRSRMLKAKQRKQQAEEKREKDKKQTIERLLKKTDGKIKGMRNKVQKRTEVPKWTYINNQDTISVSLPAGHEFPLTAQTAPQPRGPVMCGVKGCKNPKKYSCSKTGVPLCSFECYKKNLALSKPRSL